MALKRVTMQQIADACGLSRNTVSKVFNGRGSVPEATKRLVVATARDLGYYRYSMSHADEGTHAGTIALLTGHKLLSLNFGTYFISSFTNRLSRRGYTMQMYEVSDEEIAQRRLPSSLDLEQTVGILGIELFDRAYTDFVCSHGKPTLFVDGYPRISKAHVQCDFITMENTTSEMAVVKRMIDGGARRIGFLGDIEHCNSFYERWLGFCAALSEAELPINRDLCILADDSSPYGETAWLAEQLRALPELPDAFACANDFLAIRLMGALKEMGLSIPRDIMVTGFGGSRETEVVDPSLTTALIPSSDIGKLAAALLTERIRVPDFPFHWAYVQTTPIWGDSTR